MNKLGSILIFFGTVFFALFIVAMTIHRFAHPDKTETELFLWCLERWWGWILPLSVAGIGAWLLERKS